MLGVDAIPVALGIYLVFWDEAQAQTFRASRFRSRATTPRVKASVKRFEQYQEMLAPLMAFFTERGRLPIEEELQEFAALQSEFGTLRRAFQVVLQATEVQEWDAISEKRRQDLLVYLPLVIWGLAQNCDILLPSFSTTSRHYLATISKPVPQPI